MKILTISRSNLEIARAHLRKPLLTIGRSPTCDVILRAPGMTAIHFLVEWIGSGEFSPSEGAWAIVDISVGADKPAQGDAEAGEGVVLSSDPVTIGDLVFSCMEDNLESTEIIGGQIAQSLAATGTGGREVLELVKVRVDSGAVEVVNHYPVPAVLPAKPRKEKLIPEIREFKVQWIAGQGDLALKLLLEEMPGAEVFNRGQRVQIDQNTALKPNDLLQVRWRGQDFYLRFVTQVNTPPIPREFWGDPLLRKLSLRISAAGLLLLLLIRFYPNEPEKEPTPQRTARVEVVEAAPRPVEPPPAAQPQSQEIEQQKAEEKPEPSTAKAPMKAKEAPKKPGKAAAPRFISKPEAKPKAGLNSPAKVTNVNAVGILGALNKSGAKGKGVRADKILNDGIVTESATGLESSKVVVNNPPAGVIGSGSGGSPVSEGKGLTAASTTLQGAGKYDPSSVGPIARKGGASGLNIGSSLSGTGSGLGRGNELGSVDGGGFSVEGGGLDRETVRRVIQSKRGEIRTCYERALLSHTNLEGRIVYTWRIVPDGSVISVEVTNSNLDAPSLRSCVLEVIRKMTFPKAANGKATKVIYPFVFQGKR